MIKTTLLIPVYNEIKFIERTLQSVVGEADQIIISDNTSTDGTSEICREFARKHPEIEYKRHEKKNTSGSLDYLLNQAKGEYIMIIGGHDMISKNSIKNLSKLLDENPDAVLAFHKKTVFLNEFYSFDSLYLAEEFGNDLISNSPYTRVNSMVNNLSNCFMWYGLHRSDTFKAVLNENEIFDKILVDHVLLASLAKKGKVIADDNSTLFAMKNRKPSTSQKEQYERIIRIQKTLKINAIVNPYEWKLAIICGSYEIAKEMQKLPDAPPNFDKKILKNAIKRFGYIPGVEFTSEHISIIPGKEILVEEVVNAIIKEKRLQKKNFQKKIDKLVKEYDNKRVLIYGAGTFFDDINNNYDLSKLNIVAISDRKFSEETEYKGFKAIPPERINQENPDIVLIAMFKAIYIKEYFENEYFPKYGKFKYKFLSL